MLQLIWYYSTSWVSNIGDLVLVLIFWFRIIKRGWFFMLGIIASNFLKIENGWAMVIKYATAVVYVGTPFFPQSLENSRSHSNAYNLISSKKHAPIKWERNWWFYGKYAWYYQWPSETRKVSSLFGFISSHPNCFRVNQVFIMSKILTTLGGESDWCTLKNLHSCQPLTATTVFG